MTDNDDGFDLHQYQSDTINVMTNELFKLVRDQEREFGKEFADNTITRILSSIVATIVYQTLRTEGLAGEEQYLSTKLRMEEAVSAGFAAAFLNLEPNSRAEFVCQVLPVGQPLNKIPA